MSYGHRIQAFAEYGFYRLFWTIDFKYPNSRLRWPRTFSRDTDLAGAKRFAKRWNLKGPRAGGVTE